MTVEPFTGKDYLGMSWAARAPRPDKRSGARRNLSAACRRAALAVWKYCEETATWIFGARLGDSTADEILSVLRTRPEGMARNEIMDHFNRHKSGAELGRALARLRNEGYVRREKGRRTAGRQAQIWIANEVEERGRSAEESEEQSGELGPVDDDCN
jgi:hypothetical protein